MTVESMKTSLPARRGNGGLPQLSGRDAARLSTQTVLQSFGDQHDEQYHKALIVIFLGMCGEMLSSDSFSLALRRARDYAKSAGIPEGVYNEVEEVARKSWLAGRSMNPLVSLF